jgi:hypothetical protein
VGKEKVGRAVRERKWVGAGKRKKMKWELGRCRRTSSGNEGEEWADA